MTYEEFQAGLAETPELIDEIYDKHQEGYTKHLTDKKGMVVTSVEDYAKDREKAIGQGSKTAHDAWEGKFEKATGRKRPEGMKGLDWFDSISDKIRFATDNGEDPNSAIIKGLQKELQEVKDNLTKKEKEALQNRISGSVGTAIKGLNFAVPAHIKKDEDKASFLKQKAEDTTDIFNARYSAAVDDSGRLVFTNKKGEAQTQNGEPMTADQIAARDFAHDVTPKGHSQGGTGSGERPDTGGDGDTDYLGANTEEIRKKLSEKMIGFGTDAWELAYAKAHIAIGVKSRDGLDFQSIVDRHQKK